MEKRDTVGKVASELNEQAHTNTHTAEEQMRENLTDYEKNIYQCIDASKAKYAGDFYIVVITKKEKLFENVLRNFFLGRETCPTPEYDQTVYRYKRSSDGLDLIWVVPSKETVQFFLDHMLEVPQSERELLKYVLDFFDGTLLKKAKELNGEMPDSPLLIKG